ncbi:MAG: RHS repeat-associated core domain-containing protein [Planctomycetota bacterium]|nr:RHS repeat-associated core domain-containing protein [Planctomycetota bacterium]
MNVTALVNTSGTVVERYLYDSYGKPTITDANWSVITWANSKKNEILYCGYRLDPETGLYHVRHRYYHPTLGRWTARDPWETYDTLNLLQYCSADPLGRVDPFGLVGIPFPQNPGMLLSGSAGQAVHDFLDAPPKPWPPYISVKSGDEIAYNRGYCCWCVPIAKDMIAFYGFAQLAYVVASYSGRYESATDLQKAVDAAQELRWGAPPLVVGTTSPSGEVSIPWPPPPCIDLKYYATVAHEKEHHNQRIRDYVKYPNPFTRRRQYNSAEEKADREVDALDAAKPFVQEFLDACSARFGVE